MREPQAFSLALISALPVDHDPEPENPSIGWVGKIKQSTLERIHEMREQEKYRRAWHPCLKSLGHLADYIEGLRQDVLVEMEEKSDEFC